ncbi:radical SAM family heme chaperone HemW [Nitrosomonas sp.]|uniref:radical SAM family heme chaperone HemW n=1 Tax=Nitrosomonas sp. TaxID=42353 RepID=UPI0025E51EC4|nr:radical SAM family heme chaperone HemW [Nitrosomonas sp.]MCC6915980.1 oxygen-independent coproporphyrinogen III oxidase-like protein [Nitrosomonas sp.]
MPVLSVPDSKSPRLTELPPLGLYIHLPWCIRKCPYCDFNSHAIHAGGDFPESEYVAALKQDLELSLPLIWGRPVTSIFFGGGTPSLFSAAAIDAILSHVRMLLPLALGAEVTLEANPGTWETKKFIDFHSAGINRLSVGVQSFNSRHLQALGRIHDSTEASRAIELALQHFDNINLDLMYALPDQTEDEALQDIETACSWEVSHISAYHLTIEPNTPFHRYPPKLPGEDVSADMQIMIEQVLAARGYRHYETSAFALPGKSCMHNMNYWQYGDYLGIGAGAHSKISFREKIIRQMRHKHPRQYQEQATTANACLENLLATTQEVGPQDRVFEFMMNALRLTDGFDPGLFHTRTGLTVASIQKLLTEAEQRGLIDWQHDRIQPTSDGRRFLNDLLEIFLPEPGSRTST